jgi:hypothetical protein
MVTVMATTTELLGTCSDDCARACSAAEASRAEGNPLAVTLIVFLALFFVMDALIACVAIYRAGMRPAHAAVRKGEAGPERQTIVQPHK